VPGAWPRFTFRERARGSLAWRNNTVYGPAASVWSESLICLHVSAQLKAAYWWVTARICLTRRCGLAGNAVESVIGAKEAANVCCEYLSRLVSGKRRPLK